eukprot:gnl/TRDRNA2_/TRDRNA2_125364_c0_seq2.p1 gnl/TRDRNA2_/TRDRNA2_125364_c0~~gnl/TRDRNA2_/TRDRNA2_125364_c0_seq2.p1  ORF type:complete len:318 (+),score=59.88 gnl/TRDRNA2_/TRDRNA2_125364_c0_seq2:40-993(+)
MSSATSLLAVEPGDFGFTSGLPAGGTTLFGLSTCRDPWRAAETLLDRAPAHVRRGAEAADVDARGQGLRTAAGSAVLSGNNAFRSATRLLCKEEAVVESEAADVKHGGLRTASGSAVLFGDDAFRSAARMLCKEEAVVESEAADMKHGGGDFPGLRTASGSVVPVGHGALCSAARLLCNDEPEPSPAVLAPLPAPPLQVVAHGDAAWPPQDGLEGDGPPLLGECARMPFRPPRSAAVPAQAAEPSSFAAVDDGPLLGPAARRQFKRPRTAATNTSAAAAQLGADPGVAAGAWWSDGAAPLGTGGDQWAAVDLRAMGC